MKYFLCLDEIRIGDVMPMDEDGLFMCPYTGQTFSANEEACPCWPRLPMGWNWSVFWAVELADQLLQKAQEKMIKNEIAQTTSLNITTRAMLESSDGPFQGCYIDNLFTMGCDPDVVNVFQKMMTEEFEEDGLLMSEDDPAKEKRKLLGIMLDGENNEVRSPEQFLIEIAYLAERPRDQEAKCGNSTK